MTSVAVPLGGPGAPKPAGASKEEIAERQEQALTDAITQARRALELAEAIPSLDHPALRGADVVAAPSNIDVGVKVLVVGRGAHYHWQVWMGDNLLRTSSERFESFGEAEDNAKGRWFHAFKDALCGPEMWR